MELNIFDKSIIVKDKMCSINGKNNTLSKPYVNMYIRLGNKCNCNCKFCTFCGKNISFDFYKFYYIFKELNSKIRINKLSFTGGEPTLDLDNLIKCLDLVKSTNNKIFTVVNTNGTNLSLINDLDIIDSISLSRHHYDDIKNNEIFNNEMLTLQKISELNSRNNIHLSCNLLKDYIGNEEEVIKYLEKTNEYDLLDIGFVSLMKNNEYSEDQFIDFKDLNFQNYDNFTITKEFNNENYCRCRNYAYFSDSFKISNIYSRYYCDSNYNVGNLVYDINVLKQGFNGNILL